MIDIDDDVPLPEPDKPDTWRTGPDAKRVASSQLKEQWQPVETFVRYAGPNDCTFIGGPLNGQFGPIKGNPQVVELEIYDAQGNVTSVELYALGDKPTPSFRYHVGSKAP